MTTFDEAPLPELRIRNSLAAVALGGALGTFARTEILIWTTRDQWHNLATASGTHAVVPLVVITAQIPWALLGINTFGVFLAAWLLSGPLRGRSPDDGWRLFAITGILGGLTSYSALIRDVAALNARSILLASATLIGAVIAGVVAAALGARAARR